MNKKIIIIGGVAAGMSAASKAKRLNKNLDITVYEMTDIISWGACGLPYYVGNFFEDKNTMIARSYEEFKKENINIKIKHKVESVDFNSKKITIRNLENNSIFEDFYDDLVITTGASAVQPPNIKNIDAENVFNLKSFDDGIKLKKELLKSENKNITVIGAGYIGLEFVEAAVNLNKNIKILQHSERILRKTFDKEITDIMEDYINKHENISLHLNENIKEIITFENKVIGVKTDKKEYSANIVVVSTGIKPNTEFLKNSGIEMLRNGAIVIDRYGKTNIPNVYAAGDCASVYHAVLEKDIYIPLATTANKLGRLIGENINNANKKFIGTLGSAALKLLDLESGRTGITENEAIKNNINYKTVFIEDVNQTAYYPGQESLFIKLIYEADTKILLGAQMIGKKGAVLRIDALAVAIFNKMTVNDLGNMDFCYAPPFSTTWDIMNVAGNVAK